MTTPTDERMTVCEICRRPGRSRGYALCESCAKAFERDGGETYAAQLQWCARRVWHFARRALRPVAAKHDPLLCHREPCPDCAALEPATAPSTPSQFVGGLRDFGELGDTIRPMTSGEACTGLPVQPELSRDLVQAALELLADERRGVAGQARALLVEALS